MGSNQKGIGGFRSGLSLTRPRSPGAADSAILDERHPPYSSQASGAPQNHQLNQSHTITNIGNYSNDPRAVRIGAAVTTQPTSIVAHSPVHQPNGYNQIISLLPEGPTPTFNPRAVCPALLAFDGPPAASSDFWPFEDSELCEILTIIRRACASHGLGVHKVSEDNNGFQRYETFRLKSTLHDFALNESYRLEEALKIRNSVERLTAQCCPSTLLFVIIPTHSLALSSEVRRICDIDLGIHSVFLSASSVGRLMRQVDQQTYPDPQRSLLFSVELHKLKLRLGSFHRTVGDSSLDVFVGSMLVGMSTNKSSGYPTMTSVVASCEGSFTRYPASVRMQLIYDEETSDGCVSIYDVIIDASNRFR